MAGIIELNDDNFDEEISKAELPIMVDFWAPWCGPCKAIGPAVEALEETYRESMNFVKVNVDENPVVPSKYGIQAIPTLIFFKDGEVVDKITGMVAKEKLEEAIKNVI